MPHADVLRTLVSELERVGVDADHMVAGLSAHASEAIRALRSLPDDAGPAAFLHLDCYLYRSAKAVFDGLGDRIGSGTVIVLRQYFNYPGWRNHEYRAFQELVERRAFRYRYLQHD